MNLPLELIFHNYDLPFRKSQVICTGKFTEVPVEWKSGNSRFLIRRYMSPLSKNVDSVRRFFYADG